MAVHTTGVLRNWEETHLWKQLAAHQDADGLAVQTTLRTIMPSIQTVLQQGSTSAPDFTLHDAQHAFRVSQRMLEVMPKGMSSNLTVYELALLLLSAYLHDIGMTPERGLVTRYRTWLITGSPTDVGGTVLSELEREELLTWLDREAPDVELPICRASPTLEQLARVDELITYFSRHKHNDWSSDWIKQNLATHTLCGYAHWVDDLIRLCQSHHWAKSELSGDAFSPRLIANGRVVHLRYLACVLRLADILENDPERTPEVIFQLRDIAPGSRIYWWKDHELSTVIIPGTSDGRSTYRRVRMSARPRSAGIHRAILDTVRWIESELKLCRTLSLEKPFQHLAGYPDLPHRWDLEDSVFTEVSPYDDSYLYIEGAFRPDTHRLLEMLSGLQLYENRMAAVRELLQNAFDAVRETIAWLRLDREDASEPQIELELGRQHLVRLSLEQLEGEWWLICLDDGIGMTRGIIEHHLLISGSGRRADLSALERKCRERGFSVGRTGQFGIGVLSYFMLADRVAIETLRSQYPGDAESNGWSFATRGVGSFGELRRLRRNRPGTTVHLHLRSELMGDPMRWFQALREYLSQTLRRVPCRFQLECSFPDCEPFRLEPGWVPRSKELETHVLADLASRFADDEMKLEGEHPELFSRDALAALDARRLAIDQLKVEVMAALRWKEFEGTLPAGLGYYRIAIPYFELPDGWCRAFMQVHPTESGLRINNIGLGEVFEPKGTEIQSWRGMAADWPSEPTSRRVKRNFVELDWVSSEAGSISVNRHSLKRSSIGQEAIEHTRAHLREVQGDIFHAMDQSIYFFINVRESSNIDAVPSESLWLFRKWDTAEIWWNPIKVPAYYHPSSFRSARLAWCGTPMHPLQAVGEQLTTNSSMSVSPVTDLTSPDRLATLHMNGRIIPVALWLKTPLTARGPFPSGRVCDFPPSWLRVIGVSSEMLVWNRAHIIVQSITDCASREFHRLNLQTSPVTPFSHGLELLRDRAFAAEWLLHNLQNSLYSTDCQIARLWAATDEKKPEFLPALWRLFELESGSSIVMWTDHALWVMTETQFTIHLWYSHQFRQLVEGLIVNEPEWCVEHFQS